MPIGLSKTLAKTMSDFVEMRCLSAICSKSADIVFGGAALKKQQTTVAAALTSES